MLHLALVAHTPVDVDVSALGEDAAAHRLYGDLLVRLLEDGRTVGDGEDAIGLRMEVEGDAWVVVVEHGEIVARRVVEAGPADAMHLEVLHRAVELVHEVEPITPSGSPDPASFTIDLASATDDRRPLDPEVVRAVVAAGGSVTTDGTATWRLCVGRSEDGWAYRRVPASQTCGELPTSRSLSASFAEMLGLIGDDVADAIVSELYDEERVPEGPNLATAAPTPRVEASARDEPRRQAPFVWLAAGGGLATRGRQVDAEVPVVFAVAHRSGFGGMLRAAMLVGPPRSDLHVVDATIAAGPAFHRPLGKRISLGIGALVGVLLHRYRFRVEAPATDAAVQLEVPLWANLRVAPGFVLGLGVGLGVGGVEWEHVAGAQILWTRPPFRFAAGATLGWTWGWS